jgi:hypothetical protein
MKIFCSSILLISLLLLACSGARQSVATSVPASAPAQATTNINLDNLYQHWVHSREEQQPNDKDELYRPATFKVFPPSRFRMAYKFAKDGMCEWFYLSPVDAHHFKPGTWRIDPNDPHILQITKENTTETYRILTLTNDMLRIAPLTPQTIKK